MWQAHFSSFIFWSYRTTVHSSWRRKRIVAFCMTNQTMGNRLMKFAKKIFIFRRYFKITPIIRKLLCIFSRLWLRGESETRYWIFFVVIFLLKFSLYIGFNDADVVLRNLDYFQLLPLFCRQPAASSALLPTACKIIKWFDFTKHMHFLLIFQIM